MVNFVIIYHFVCLLLESCVRLEEEVLYSSVATRHPPNRLLDRLLISQPSRRQKQLKVTNRQLAGSKKSQFLLLLRPLNSSQWMWAKPILQSTRPPRFLILLVDAQISLWDGHETYFKTCYMHKQCRQKIAGPRAVYIIENQKLSPKTINWMTVIVW